MNDRDDRLLGDDKPKRKSKKLVAEYPKTPDECFPKTEKVIDTLQEALHTRISSESERMANEPVKKMSGTRAKGAAAVALTHEDWVDVYKGVLDKSLIAAATKAEEGIRRNSGQEWQTVQITALYINNKLPPAHPTGAVAEVGIEINIRENGVQRLLMRKVRYFKTMVHYTAGRDQGMFEALQDVFEDLFTFAIASDMAMRHEKNSMQPKSH